MSEKLREIFKNHQDKYISFSFGNKHISEAVMTEDKFVEIVSKILKHNSRGIEFNTLQELHSYLEI